MGCGRDVRGCLISALTVYMGAIAVPTRVAPDDPRVDTVLALDAGIRALTNPSADFRTILRSLPAGLPPGADSSVRLAITRFLNRAPGSDVQCSADFLRLSARRELLRIKESLLGLHPEPRKPEFCYAAPYAIDVGNPGNTLEIYGYDFDVEPIELFLVNADGYHDVTAAMTLRTHYHLSVRLGKGGVQFATNSQVLGLTWGNLIHHAVALVQPSTSLCASTIQEIPAGKTIAYSPALIRGDRRFAGPPARVWAHATVDYRSNAVDVMVCMTVEEPGGDRTTFTGCGSEYVTTIDPDREIEWLFGGLESRASYTPTGRRPAIRDGSDDELVRRWTFSGVGRSPTADADPHITIELKKIRMVTIAPDGCVSPIAFLEAKRAGALSPPTMRRLEAQLTKVDPGILTLRPRFAPAIR
jgi:hypothetical protein